MRRDDGGRSGRCGGRGTQEQFSSEHPFFTVLSGTMRNLPFVIIDKGSCLVPLTPKGDDFEILGL